MEHGARSRRGTFFNFNGTAGVWRRARHRRCRRLAARHAHRRHRSFLSRAAPGLEIPLPAGHRMRLGTARRDERLQGAASALGQGPDADREENPSARLSLQRSLARQGRSLLPSHRQHSAIRSWCCSPTMLLPAMIVRFYQGWFQMLFIDLPLFLASTCSISSFYLVAQRELHPKTWMKTFLYMPFVMATGIGLSVRNAQAVIEAIVGKKSEFARTPKFKIEGKTGTLREKIQQQSRLDALPRNRPRPLLFPDHSFTPSPTKITPPCRSCCSSSGAISTPASCRSANPGSRISALASTPRKCAPPPPALPASDFVQIALQRRLYPAILLFPRSSLCPLRGTPLSCRNLREIPCAHRHGAKQ